MRVPLLVAVLAALAGCAVPSTAPRDLARGLQADSLGDTHTAYRLYRAAAHGGSLDAQMHLAGSRESSRWSWVSALVSPYPDAAEKAVWTRTARATAQRLADAGDPEGHLALGHFAYSGPDLMSYGKPGPDSLALARRHYEAAVALGSRQARQQLAYHVWMSDGLLASESYFRASHAAGNAEAASMLSLIALQRPLLDRGLTSRDMPPGDLSLIDVVGSARVLRDAGDAESLGELNTRVGALREQARVGNAEADSLLTVLGAAGLLG